MAGDNIIRNFGEVWTRMTLSELAAKLHVTKSYISRIENGLINPSVTVFYRIIDALGMRVEIVKPIC